ncbi:MAG TPA: hypothetical protein VNN62_01100 [Methylomirabilota bacterium]|nr:hypothetical protein [Methylomirabilota bacterium]
MNRALPFPEARERKPVTTSATRPLSITVLVCLILIYAVVVIGWDMVMPFERAYTQGPATVAFGLRISGWPAQIMHAVQLIVALALAYGLWHMQAWAWRLLLLVVGYILLSTTVWVAVYQEFGRIMFAFLNLVIVNVLLAFTFPHRDQFA